MKRVKFFLLPLIMVANAIFLYADMQDNFVTKSMYSYQWRNVQEKTKDTVVQVFSHIATIDLLQPYKTPDQKSVRGTGFFIDQIGHIVTNAHVVNQAVDIRILIPSLGKRFLKVDLVSIYPETDLALLKVCEKDFEFIVSALGGVSFLPLGDSDTIYRSDEVMAIGYPLGQYSLKSTTGVVSGREHDLIQITAPINPGNSGGPLLNTEGEVVGINSCGVREAQNVGYIIPINRLKIFLDDMKKNKFMRSPMFGGWLHNSTESLAGYLGNPEPGGFYISYVIKGGLLEKNGIQKGDVLYKVGGYNIDIYGEMDVDWSEDKVSLFSYISRLKVGDEVDVVLYRKGEEIALTATIENQSLDGIHDVFPGYDTIEYEIFAGMVVMPLSLNHINLLGKSAPGLISHCKEGNMSEPVLVVSHIFPGSELFNSRTLDPGCTLDQVNGIKVKTLHDFREAVLKSSENNLLVMKAYNNSSLECSKVLVVLPLDTILQQENYLSKVYLYPTSDLASMLAKGAC